MTFQEIVDSHYLKIEKKKNLIQQSIQNFYELNKNNENIKELINQEFEEELHNFSDSTLSKYPSIFDDYNTADSTIAKNLCVGNSIKLNRELRDFKNSFC